MKRKNRPLEPSTTYRAIKEKKCNLVEEIKLEVTIKIKYKFAKLKALAM